MSIKKEPPALISAKEVPLYIRVILNRSCPLQLVSDICAHLTALHTQRHCQFAIETVLRLLKIPTIYRRLLSTCLHTLLLAPIDGFNDSHPLRAVIASHAAAVFLLYQLFIDIFSGGIFGISSTSCSACSRVSTSRREDAFSTGT